MRVPTSDPKGDEGTTGLDPDSGLGPQSSGASLLCPACRHLWGRTTSGDERRKPALVSDGGQQLRRRLTAPLCLHIPGKLDDSHSCMLAHLFAPALGSASAKGAAGQAAIGAR